MEIYDLVMVGAGASPLLLPQAAARMERSILAVPLARADISAGWHGIAMGKTYHEICPNSRMLIIDSSESIGGTWAKERLYPGLKTNNIIGSYEFGDFPMTPAKFGVSPGQHIPGAVVHEYLCQYAAAFDLVSRLRMKTKVE